MESTSFQAGDDSRAGFIGRFDDLGKRHGDGQLALPRDQNARARLVIDALPIVERGDWESLQFSSKELLNAAGLLKAVPQIPLRFVPTVEFVSFWRLIDTLPMTGKIFAARALLLATERCGVRAADGAISHMSKLAEWFQQTSSAPDNATVGAYRKFMLALLEDRNLDTLVLDGNTPGFFRERLTRVKLHSALVDCLASTDERQAQRAGRYLVDEVGNMDIFPHRDQTKVWDQATSLAARSWKIAYNFDRFSVETRRAGPGVECLMARFGMDSFGDCRVIFGSSIERTPGRGYYLSEPRMDKLFFAELVRNGTYAQSYQHYGRAMEQFSDATFCFLRGGIVVYHPAALYRLPVGPALPSQREEPYALFLANDHFSGGYELAALLPVRVLQRYLMPCLQAFDSSPGDPAPADISMPGFNLTTLVKACETAGLPAIMLANISTVFGGSVAGYPKNSEPFYAWEAAVERCGDFRRNALGRVLYERKRQDRGEPGHFQELQKLLGNGCDQVAYVANGLLDLLDLFMARYDAWKNELGPSEAPYPRMLAEAYTWHSKLRERNAPGGDFPLLCVAHRYDWTRSPEVVLDTQTLEIMLGDGKRFALPPGSRRDRVLERSVWMKHVMPRVATEVGTNAFAERDTTLLLLPREYLNSYRANVPLSKREGQ